MKIAENVAQMDRRIMQILESTLRLYDIVGWLCPLV